ncbi:hypothetical protein ACFP2T_03595 [Plantactinospora solaniradicis]|uniref:Uncharacterized protein n=1 Tax=Plantactinospora solaniradicis TaxID=1723736 RepID=A0ABW1K2S4_9ACTN
MSSAWDRLGRLTEAGLKGAKALGDKARGWRDEVTAGFGDEPERALVEPLLPGQTLHYVGLESIRLPELHKVGRQFADEMARNVGEALDPRTLFGLLNIVNPALWVEAVIWPVRRAAEIVMLPIDVATGVTAQKTMPGTTEPSTPPQAPEAEQERRQPLPLPPEQEAFRAMFRLSAYRPLAEQLAEIAYKRRYTFSGELASSAGSMLLFLTRFTGTPLAVTDTHLHLLRMGRRPDEGKPDRRQPRVLWSMDRRHIARIDAQHSGTRVLSFPMTITFDDGSWIRVTNPSVRVDQWRFYAAVSEIPGDRPRPGSE